MKKIISLALISMMTLSACAGSNSEAEVGRTTETTNDGTGSKVYFTKEITPESLVSIYEALGVKAEGKRVAVKISTGESSRTNYLRPEFIKNLVQKLDANIVECNTAYGGSRGNTAAHRRVIAERGFNDIATVDIMDAEGTMDIPVSVTSDYSSGEKFNRFFGIFANNLPSPFNTAPAAAIITLIVWIGISIAIGLLSLFVLKSIFKVIDKDSDTLGKNTTIGVSVCVFLAGLVNSAYIIGASEAVIDQLKTFTGILYILFVAMIVWDVYKALITGALQKMEKKNLGGGMDTSLIPLFKAIGKMVIILFCIALILSKFGVNFATLITSAGLTGLGLSFGVKPAINELFSGLIVLITRPFKVGDYVTVAGEGRYKVAEIGILRTEFDTGFTMETATMPNSKIASSKIVNISHRTLKYRNTISIKVPFNSNLTLIKKLVKKIASDHPDVVTDGSVPKPNAVFTSCNDGSAIIVTLSFYVRDFDVNATTTCKIREEILRVFRERGITIPLNKMEATIYRGGQSDA